MSDSSPTTLNSLRDHADPQGDLIKSLSELDTDEPAFADLPDNNRWVKFHSSAWGGDPVALDHIDPVTRGPDKIDDSLILPDTVPEKCSVMPKPDHLDNCWPFRSLKKIFIRPEYEEAEASIISHCGTRLVIDALVVIGQPGIGKSVFLLRLLIRRLAHKLPTALQIDKDHAVLFHEGGVKKFKQLTMAGAYTTLWKTENPLDRIWALVDSNTYLQEPASIFIYGPFYTVQTAFPSHNRQRWTKRIRAKYFYMKSWPFSEVLQVRPFIESPSEKAMWYLHSKYGASLRDQILYANDPDKYRHLVTTEIKKLSLRQLTQLLQTNTSIGNAHYLVSIGPMPGDRTQFERGFVSPFVLEEYHQLVIGDETEKLRKFFNILYGGPAMSNAARKVFGIQAHHFLQKGKVLNLFPILSHSTPQDQKYIYNNYTATRSNVVGQQYTLPDLEECLVTKETPITDNLNTYYHPQGSNFPSIDSWVLVHNSQEPLTLLVFQIMVTKEDHNVNRVGLDRLDGLVPAHARKHLVVLTPKGTMPQISVPTDYLTKTLLGGRKVDEVFPISHCPIDSTKLFKL